MPLKDLIVYLANRLATGVLSLEREGTRKQVHLEDGRIVNASSNLPREYLGQFLINMGQITEEQAKTMWCPDSRVLAADSAGNVREGAPTAYNRGMGTPNQLPGATTCLGSACMAWRWDRTFLTPAEPTVGYCGRGGRIG